MSDLLINKGTVERKLQVSLGVEKQSFKRFVSEAQYMDLKPLFCEEFYADIVVNYTADNYQTLLKGGEYTHEDKSYTFKGLEDVISYFTYGRFIYESPVNSSSFGMVRKKTNHSEPVPLNQLESFANKHFDKAIQIFEGVKKYLDRKEYDFEFWECDSCNETTENSIEVWK